MKTLTRLLSLLALAAGAVHAAPQVTITVTPNTAVAPASATLAWSSTGAVSCTASGSWSGTKATSGTQALTNLTTNASYVLTCRDAATGQAVLTWQPPTKNMDDTPLTDLAGFRVLYGTSAGSLGQSIDVPGAAKTSYTVDGLTPATYYFAVRAYNAVGGESENSNVASKVIPAQQSATASATFTVKKVPGAPTLTVADAAAREFTIGYQDQLKTSVIGTVPVGWPCAADQPQTCIGSTCYSIVSLGNKRIDLVKVLPGKKVPLQVWADCRAVS